METSNGFVLFKGMDVQGGCWQSHGAKQGCQNGCQNGKINSKMKYIHAIRHIHRYGILIRFSLLVAVNGFGYGLNQIGLKVKYVSGN